MFTSNEIRGVAIIPLPNGPDTLLNECVKQSIYFSVVLIMGSDPDFAIMKGPMGDCFKLGE